MTIFIIFWHAKINLIEVSLHWTRFYAWKLRINDTTARKCRKFSGGGASSLKSVEGLLVIWYYRVWDGLKQEVEVFHLIQTNNKLIIYIPVTVGTMYSTCTRLTENEMINPHLKNYNCSWWIEMAMNSEWYSKTILENLE